MASPLPLPVFNRDSLDNSIISDLDKCSRYALYKHHLARAPGLRNYPLSFGEAYHIFQDTIEKAHVRYVLTDKKPFDDAMKALTWQLGFGIATRTWVDPDPEHKKGYLDIGRLEKTCKEAYLAWIEEKEVGIWKTISTEAPFQLELPGFWRCSNWMKCDLLITDGEYERLVRKWGASSCPKCDKPLQRRKFTGKIDRVFDWNGYLWIRDFKTSGRKEDFNKKHNPAHQFTGYAWAVQQLSGRKVVGTLIDIAYNIKSKGPEFYVAYAERSPGDIAHWMEWVHDSFSQWEYRVRSGIWPMKTEGCNRWGGCYFKDACNSGDWNQILLFLKSKTVEKLWDPMDVSGDVEDDDVD